MKNIILYVALLSGIFTYGQNTASTANQTREAKSLLWKLSGNGLAKPSYLYGTIHITCDAALDQNTLRALDNTSQLYLELDMDDPNIQASMMSGMTMKNGVTISSLLSAADFEILDAYFQKEMGLSIRLMNTIKPMVLSTIMLPDMLDCPMQSVESELMKVTTSQKEEVFGLESIEDQLAVFDAISDKNQIDDLVTSVKDNFKSDKAEMAKMHEVYRNKDLDAILKMMDESEGMESKNQDVLLVNRNKNWIPKIEAIAKEKSTFFGVGAAHLPGEQGVIALLRAKGYFVEPVF